MSVTCSECKHQNPQGEEFCESCGADLSAIAKPVAPTPAKAEESVTAVEIAAITPQPKPVPKGKKVVTLKVHGQEYDIHTGQELKMARYDGEGDAPDISLIDDNDPPKISSTPLIITADKKGNVTVKDTGKRGFFLAKFISAGQEAELNIHDFMIVGNATITVE